MDWREDAKKRVAFEAAKHVKNGFVIGLGSGTTVGYVFQELGRRMREKELSIHGVPTSYQALLLAVQHKIPLTTLHEHTQLDLTIDGADQVDPLLNMIKGAGGALTREKIVASISKTNIIVIDNSKLIRKLGLNHPIPVEVLPFALNPVLARLNKLGSKPNLRIAKEKLGPVVTDNGNFIIDVDFDYIKDPEALDQSLKAIPGVVETGLFIEMADIVYVGGRETIQKLEK